MHLTNKILRFIRNIFALLLLATGVFAQPNENLIEGVMAVVGKNIVLKSEADAQYEAFKRQSIDGQDITKCRVLEELLFQKLLVHHAEIDSVTVGEEEVEGNMDRRLQQLIAQMGGDSRKLEEYYGKSIIEIKEEMRPLMTEQLTAQRMQMSITEGVEVTPTEIQEFYNSIPQDSLPLINTEVEVAQIVKYPEVSPEAEKEVKDKLNELKARIENGSSFSSMAILYSEDPGSNKNGGKYTGIKRGQFVKEFEAVAFNLKPLEVSDPFKTQYGYHIVQLLEKRGEELDLRHILIKPKFSQDNLNEARNFLDSLAVMIANGQLTWNEAVNEYSEDEQTKNNNGVLANFESGTTKFEVSQLEREMYDAIKDLEVNEVSLPSFFRTFDQKEAFRLIKLNNRIEPHKANLRDDYQRIKGFALQEKQQRVVKEWTEEKINETYIKVNTNYVSGCEVDEKWLNNNTEGL
jgi:peptidyl-prolyl cis-trans isomerase SurA